MTHSQQNRIRIASLLLGVALPLVLAACNTNPVAPPKPDIRESEAPPPPPPPPMPMNRPSTESVVVTAGRTGSVRALGADQMAPTTGYWQPSNTSHFPDSKPNAVVVTATQPVSTFSIDVDTASYGVVRDALNGGALPPADAVRIEEMVNYFDYSYPLPEKKEAPFRASVRVYPAPWNKDTQVLHIGIKGFDIPKKERPPANLVFLIDTSGSMDEPNKLPLLIRSFHLLVDQLGPKDHVSIVAYAGSAGVVLQPTSGADHAKILAALDQLQAGNGNAAFIDTLNEAHKVFVDQISGTLFTIANDVKIQIEFNPARVAEYRLIGYETRMLNETDFKNDKVDAGDIGSGTTVTGLYEITPVGSKATMADPHRYATPPKGDPDGELAFLKIRYKLPCETMSKLIERPITNADVATDFNAVPPDMRFAAAVVGAAQLMRHDPYIKDFSYDRAKTIAVSARGDDPFGYRSEFIRMLDLAKTAASHQALNTHNGQE